MIQAFAPSQRNANETDTPGPEMPQADLDDVMLPVKCLFLTNPVWS